MPQLLRQMMARLQNATDDGSDAGGGGAPAPAPAEQHNERLDAMDQIADRNMAEIDADLAAQGMTLQHAPPAAPKPDPDTAGTPTPTPPADDQITLQLGAEPVPIETLDKVRVKMNIDGKEEVRTVEQWRRETQLDGAARSRLNQATEILNAARATAAAPVATPAPSAPPAGSDAAPPKKDSPDVAAKAQQIVKALMEGNDADAVKTLTEALSEGREAPQQPAAPATPTAEDLMQTLVPAVKQQLSQESDLKKFAADFKDIVADPYLAEVADRNLAAVLQKEPNKPYAEALQKAGDDTRAWMQRVGMKPATEPAGTTIVTRKLETPKESIDNVGGLGTKATTAEIPEPSVSDVIAEMRNTRLAA